VVVFPELALTTFFPRWVLPEAEVESFFESDMPNAEVLPLFDAARALHIGLHLGYAERTADGRRFNTSILVDKDGQIIGRYRKIHLPGTAEPVAGRSYQHLEKRYFDVGDLGFRVFPAFRGQIGLCICNDRRWPETYRVLALGGCEMVLLGYNTPVGSGDHFDRDALAPFHNHLVMQAGAYQNSMWVVGVAKCGCEEGSNLIGQSAIIAPSGEIVAQAITLEDELVVARCDLDFGQRYRADLFAFERHRRPEHYQLIVERVGRATPSG
jgi:predicted amidohydrolase